MMKALLMNLKRWSPALFAVLLAAPARADVSLSLTDGDATPASTVVLPGSTFTVTARLLSTAQSVTGVDYYLQAAGAASGKFRITDRNIGASPFSDAIKANAGDNGANPGIADLAVSLLNPRNGLDLGASVANVNVPVSPGDYLLATFTLSVPANISPGSYVISTTSDPGTGWVASAPLFDEASFKQNGSFTVVVNSPPNQVPEPGAALAIAGFCALFLRRR